MEEKKSNLSGVQRAAVFLMSLGEEHASAVLRHMSPKEVQKLGETIAILEHVDKETVVNVLSDFSGTVDAETSLGVGKEEYLRNVLIGALGHEKAHTIIDRILLGRNTKGLETLKWMAPRGVAEIIRLEHPQIIAIVLAYLEGDHASEVLAALPESMRADILMRIATLDGIQPNAIQELDAILDKQFSGNKDSVKSSGVGGVKKAANILNMMDVTLENQILDQVKEADVDMCQELQDLMFVFENLVDLADRDIQTLLREISSENLIVALKGSDDLVKNKILKNMSKRAGDMLRDDLETKGPVRVSEVDLAQKEILAIARRLAESGEINLGGSSAEEYV